MLTTLRVRREAPSRRALPDPRNAEAEGFCGLPVLSDRSCPSGCAACLAVCPARALERRGAAIALDLGRCLFCRECVHACPEGQLRFSSEHRLGSGTRGGLVVEPGRRLPAPAAASAAFRRLYGRSLKLHRAALGGCDGCDGELRACADGHFDMGRWGIDWVGSPRDADGLVVSGPVASAGDDELLRRTWAAIAGPKVLIAVGACAIGGGPHHDSPPSGFFADHTPALFLPGCPLHPLTFIHGVLDLLGIA